MARKNRKFRDFLIHQIPSDNDGAICPKETLARLITARDEVTRQSNNFLITSIAFVILYCLRNIGLRLDLTVFDYKIFETPYGLFSFCIVSSICYVIAMSRFMDARVFDRYAKATCEKFWPNEAEYAYNTYPRINAWLEPTGRILKSLREKKIIGPVSSGLICLSGLALFLIYSSAIFACVHFIWNFSTLSNEAGKNFQFWSVVGMLTLDCAFLLSTFAITEADID